MNIINAFVLAVIVSLASQPKELKVNEPRAVIPFEMGGSHITVYASVNGSEKIPFTFDTGGGTGLVDRESAEQIGIKETSKVAGMGAGGLTEFSVSSGNTITMGGLNFTDNDLVIADLSHMKEFGAKTRGVLGYQQIVNYVVKIDYEKKELLFYDKETYEYEGNGTEVHIGLERRIPSIDGEIELVDGTKVSGRFLIDTGAALYAAMNSPSVKKYSAIESLNKSYVIEGAGATSKFFMTQGRVKSLTIAGHSFEGTPLTFSESDHGATADANYIGLIGNNIMRRFNIILDYGNNRMILEPNEQYDYNFRVNSSGIFLNVDENNNLVVQRVIKGSPADQIGMKKGDILLKTGHMTCSGSNRIQIIQFLEQSGKEVVLSWQREGKKMKGKTTLMSLI